MPAPLDRAWVLQFAHVLTVPCYSTTMAQDQLPFTISFRAPPLIFLTCLTQYLELATFSL